ncbi:MAG: TIGR04086 family membrane protein [Clostridia bacterium]|nr:TIGR04086 family membrane protein [Clostridia bacterium]
MDRLFKKERTAARSGREESPSLVRAVLFGLGAFLAVAFLLSLGATAFAYAQKDPNAYLFLGSICPFLATVPAGAISGRMYRERPWMSGGISGLASALLLWLLSAGMEGQSSMGRTLLLYLCVALLFVLSALLFGRVRQNTRRRPKRRQY